MSDNGLFEMNMLFCINFDRKDDIVLQKKISESNYVSQRFDVFGSTALILKIIEHDLK